MAAQTTEALLAQLSSSDGMLAGLTHALRIAYATGRSTRAITRAVLAIGGNSELPSPLRLLAFEVLWAVISHSDLLSYRALLRLSLAASTARDSNDVTLAALSVLASCPAHMCVDALLAEDAERVFMDCITGDAPPAVKSSSVLALGTLAHRAYMCVSHEAHVAAASHVAGQLMRARVSDKAMAVLRVVAAAADDADVLTCTAAHAYIAWLFKHRGGGAARDRLRTAIVTRLYPRLEYIFARIASHASGVLLSTALKGVTRVLTHMVRDGGTSPAGLHALVRGDHTPAGAEPTVAATLIHWCDRFILPACASLHAAPAAVDAFLHVLRDASIAAAMHAHSGTRSHMRARMRAMQAGVVQLRGPRHPRGEAQAAACEEGACITDATRTSAWPCSHAQIDEDAAPARGCSPTAAALAPALTRALPRVFAAACAQLRVCSPAGASVGVIIHTAGVVPEPGVASPSGSATLGLSGGGSGGGADSATTASVADRIHAASGAGSGAGSSLMSPPALLSSLHACVALWAHLPPRTVLSCAPALLRECARIPDDVHSDPHAETHTHVHNSTRAAALMRIMALIVHVCMNECLPTHALDGYTAARALAAATGSRGAGTPPAAPPIHVWSILLARIAHEATRTVVPVSSGASTHASALAATAAAGATGNAHGVEVSTTCTRFRAEVYACMCISLCSACPDGAVLARVAAGPAPKVANRIADAVALHAWLAAACDTLAASIWCMEHRLTYMGVSNAPLDTAASTLAHICGAPDLPTPAPATVPHAAPVSLYCDDARGRVSTPAGAPANAATSGWAWAREFEAVSEASDAALSLLTLLCACLHPPALAHTYTPGGAVSPHVALHTALCVDMLPPALLALHRSRMQTVLYMCSRLELRLWHTYEMERAVASLTPRVLATTTVSSSVTRGFTYDTLPSALPLCTRLMWLCACVWDGTDGGGSAARSRGGIAAFGVDALLRGTAYAPSHAAVRAHAARAGVRDDAAGALAHEALRQKRLAMFVHSLVSEAATALGVGSDMETAAARGIEVAASIARGHAPLASVTSSASRAEAAAAAAAASAPSPAAASSSSWLRGSKIGRALGFFGSSPKDEKKGDAQVLTYSGEGTVVSHAHFWLLIDMLVHMASTQRCVAGAVKRACECMLVQPKLSAHVRAVLCAAIPRLCAYSAAYGRSHVAKELLPLDDGAHGVACASRGGDGLRTHTASAGVLAAVAAEASHCARDPWSFTLFAPHRAIDVDGTLKDMTTAPSVSDMLDALAGMRKSATIAAAAGVAAVHADVVADTLTTPALALIAAAAAPELTQNVTLGLNRSVASGAHMRTCAPISACHGEGGLAYDVAAIALNTRWSMRRREYARAGAGAVTAGRAVPREYTGCVPSTLLDIASGLARDPAFTASSDTNGVRTQRLADQLSSAVGESLKTGSADGGGQRSAAASASRARSLLLELTTAHIAGGDDVLRHCTRPSYDADDDDVMDASSSALTRSVLRDIPAALRSLALHDAAAIGSVVTSSCDPFVITCSHVLHPSDAGISFRLSVTNATGIRIPAGMRVCVQLGGVLMFDRSGITSAQLISSQVRLGASATTAAAGGSSSSSMGAAAVGHALSGDFIYLQRGGNFNGTHTVTRAVPPGATVTYDMVLAVSGFGPGIVKVVTSCDTVEAEEVGAEEALPAAAAAAARASRSVGATVAEDAVGDDDAEEDIDWSRAGVAQGGVTGGWAAELSDSGAAPTSDGLIWSGPDLNVARKGRLLPGAASTGVTVSRSSAGRGLSSSTSSGGTSSPGPARQPSASSASGGDVVMREWATRDTTATSVASPVRSTRRGSASAPSVAGTMVDRDRDSDGGSAHGPGTVGGATGVAEDDASSVSASDAGGAAAGDGSLVLDGDAAASVSRPYRVQRLEFSSCAYRIDAWHTLLLPHRVQLPRAIALAIATGCDMLPGASTAFGTFGVPSLLAAASVEGGGMLGAAAFSGGMLSATGGAVASIANAMFASTAARLPYAHYGVAASAPFFAVQEVGEGDSSPPPLSSPAHIARVFDAAMLDQWARLPLPLCPPLHAPAADAAGIRDVAQVAYSARTWAGTNVLLFVTAMLTRTRSSAETAQMQWQLSLQLRTDDARVRATFASEFPLFVHACTGGRFVTVTHGHEPSPASMLQRIEVLQERATTGAPISGYAPLGSVHKIVHTTSADATQDAVDGGLNADSVFTMLPMELLGMSPDGEGNDDVDPGHAASVARAVRVLDTDVVPAARAAPTGAPIGAPVARSGGGIATMRLDDFFGGLASSAPAGARPAAADVDPFA